jgi:hypothetical protein
MSLTSAVYGCGLDLVLLPGTTKMSINAANVCCLWMLRTFSKASWSIERRSSRGGAEISVETGPNRGEPETSPQSNLFQGHTCRRDPSPPRESIQVYCQSGVPSIKTARRAVLGSNSGFPVLRGTPAGTQDGHLRRAGLRCDVSRRCRHSTSPGLNPKP